MAYTTAAAIEAEFKSATFGATTAVKSADITEFIAQEEAALDARIGKKYVVPITSGTNALAIMKMLATLYVKARVLDILQVKSGDAKADQGVTGEKLRERADGIVEKILDGSMKLDSQSTVETGGGVKYYVREDSDGNEIEPSFQRDEDAW